MLYPYPMNFQTRMRRIYDFLKPYQSIWQNEIMLLYPDCFVSFPSDWLDEISQINDITQLVQLEKRYYQGLVNAPKLVEFYEQIEQLTKFPSPQDLPPLPESKFSWIKVIPKKQHEIRKLAPLINDFYKSQQVDGLIDIGGGIGLLSQTLAQSYQLKITSLDMDATLQETGKNRYAKYAQKEVELEFKKVKVSKDEEAFLKELHPQRMTVGLHTCGPLAVDQIRASAENKLKAIINLGCCYLKLNENGEDQNLSQFSQSFPSLLVMNPFALTLACGAHRKVSNDSVAFKRKVKLFRYTLHILLADHYQRPQLTIFGNSSGKDYDGKFSDYVKTQFQKVGFELKHSDEELEVFYQDKLPTVKRMYSAGFIRDALSRLLEVYLLLDRAIYLEEQGYDVKIWEVFDENISPRNLGIFAHLKN